MKQSDFASAVSRLAAALVAAAATTAAASAADLFRDVAAEAGIAFQHHSAPEKKYIVESMAGGLALIDYDGDGLLDVYLVNSLTVATARDPRSAPSSLYRNLGNGRFVDVAVAAGIAYPGWGMGVCVADADGDGWQDLYVTALGPNRLYRNRGDGTFEDIAAASGVAGGGWSAGCGFADPDRDGDLDLFVSRYVKVDLDHLPEPGREKTCQYRGVAVQCGPRGLPGTSDLYFRNEGGMRFVEVAAQVGLGDPHAYFGLGIAWLDVDEDGWLDLYVANDTGPNFLYRNKRDGTFSEDAFPSGVAVSENGAEQGSMGIAVGDYENDGRLAIFVTNFADENNAFYRNHRGGYFTDVSFRTKTAASSLPYVGWGTAFFDYDQDGWLDIVVVNGHVYPQLDHARLGASAAYRQRSLLYHNRGDGTFDEVGEQTPALLEERVGRGLALGDLDGDGRLDLMLNDLDGSARLLRNEYAAPGNWLMVKLLGPAGNTDALGALIAARSGERTQTRLVRSGTSYVSQDEMAQHFGLAAAARADSVEVRWPDGRRTVLRDVPANRVVTVEATAAAPARRSARGRG